MCMKQPTYVPTEMRAKKNTSRAEQASTRICITKQVGDSEDGDRTLTWMRCSTRVGCDASSSSPDAISSALPEPSTITLFSAKICQRNCLELQAGSARHHCCHCCSQDITSGSV